MAIKAVSPLGGGGIESQEFVAVFHYNKDDYNSAKRQAIAFPKTSPGVGLGSLDGREMGTVLLIK